MKKRNKKNKPRSEIIYGIALAGISAAIALLLVWLGVVVRFSTLAFFVAAGIALMVPVFKKYYLSAFLAYAASAALSFAVTGDVISVIGYILYFGPASIIAAVFIDKKVKWYFAYPFKLLYINGAIALLYFVFGTLIIDESIIGDVPYWAIAIIGSIGLLLIDLLLQLIYKRIVPRVSRAIHGKKDKTEKNDGATSDNAVENDGMDAEDDEDTDDENPFDDMSAG